MNKSPSSERPRQKQLQLNEDEELLLTKMYAVNE
jgi:hypothetical protein